MNGEREQIERLLSQMGDGGLTDAERAAVADALAADASLAADARGYERLAALLAGVRADRVDVRERSLADSIRQAVRQELEFQISQGLDGDVSAGDSVQLDRLVRASSELSATRDAMQRVNALLEARAADVPDVNMAALASRIRKQVAREAVGEGIAGRRLRWAAYAAPLALAAAVALAVFLSRSPSGSAVPGPSAAPMVAVNVDIPQGAPGGKVEVSFDPNEPVEFAKAREQMKRPETGVVEGRRVIITSPPSSQPRFDSRKALY